MVTELKVDEHSESLIAVSQVERSRDHYTVMKSDQQFLKMMSANFSVLGQLIRRVRLIQQ